MGKKSKGEKSKLLGAPPKDHTSFFSWRNCSRASIIWICPTALLNAVFNCTSIALQRVFAASATLNIACDEGEIRGHEAAEQEESYGGQASKDRYAGRNTVEKASDKRYDFRGDALLFSWGTFTCVSSAYIFAFSAGYTRSPIKKMSFLATAFFSLGFNISLNFIAQFLTNEEQDRGLIIGEHNGYVNEYCKKFDCDDLPKNNTFVTETYPCRVVAPDGEGFFGNPALMIGTSFTIAAACILLGYHHGNQLQRDKQLSDQTRFTP